MWRKALWVKTKPIEARAWAQALDVLEKVFPRYNEILRKEEAKKRTDLCGQGQGGTAVAQKHGSGLRERCV